MLPSIRYNFLAAWLQLASLNFEQGLVEVYREWYSKAISKKAKRFKAGVELFLVTNHRNRPTGKSLIHLLSNLYNGKRGVLTGVRLLPHNRPKGHIVMGVVARHNQYDFFSAEGSVFL